MKIFLNENIIKCSGQLTVEYFYPSIFGNIYSFSFMKQQEIEYRINTDL